MRTLVLTGSESGEQSLMKAAKSFWFHGNMRNLEAFWNSCFIMHGESPSCCHRRTQTLYVSHCGPADSHRQPPRETTCSSAGVKTSWLSNGCSDFQERRIRRETFFAKKNLKSAEFCNHPDDLRSQSCCCVRLVDRVSVKPAGSIQHRMPVD